MKFERGIENILLKGDLKDVVKITTSTKHRMLSSFRRINGVTANLIDEYGYCPICANELLGYVSVCLTGNN